VRSSQGAQFTPAGVLRLPVPSQPDPASLLSHLKDNLASLTPEPATA